jgi:hypothetical protein
MWTVCDLPKKEQVYSFFVLTLSPARNEFQTVYQMQDWKCFSGEDVEYIGNWSVKKNLARQKKQLHGQLFIKVASQASGNFRKKKSVQSLIAILVYHSALAV